MTTVLPAAAAASSDPTPDGSTGAVTATYVRWVITGRRSSHADETYIQATELILTGDGTDISGGGSTPVTNPGGDNPDGEGPEKAFDGDTGTKWLDRLFALDPSATDGESVLLIEFPAPVTFDAYRWVTGNDFDHRDPVSWTLEVSDDGSNWTVVDAVASHSTTTDRQAVVGPFDL